MIKKFTVVWLLSLFVWNVALAEVPSLLLCLHDDLVVHVEPEGATHGCCDDQHTEPEETEHCAVDEGCTDLELLGGESIPARLNDVHAIDLPLPMVSECYYQDDIAVAHTDLAVRQLPVRAPPVAATWLTDLYISKTVLRV